MTPIPSDRIDEQGVHVCVHIAAEPATVWRFLSDGPRFAAWIGAFAGQKPLPRTAVDPRVGGSVQVEYPGGQLGVGKITAMEPLKRVAFTWGYQDESQGVAPGSTQVEITLSPVADGTLVRLVHNGLPTDKARQGHCGGWKHYLSMLSRDAAGQQHGESAAKAFESYFRAWAETDATARRRLLEQCCEPDVRMRGAFACTDGLEQLAAHVANAQMHMPGCTLAAAGPLQTLHGHARVGWAVRTADGKEIMRGVNFAVLTNGGRMSRIISFGDPPAE